MIQLTSIFFNWVGSTATSFSMILLDCHFFGQSAVQRRNASAAKLRSWGAIWELPRWRSFVFKTSWSFNGGTFLEGFTQKPLLDWWNRPWGSLLLVFLEVACLEDMLPTSAMDMAAAAELRAMDTSNCAVETALWDHMMRQHGGAQRCSSGMPAWKTWWKQHEATTPGKWTPKAPENWVGWKMILSFWEILW